MWSCPHRALCRFEVERGHVTMMALNLKGQDRFNGSAQASRCAPPGLSSPSFTAGSTDRRFRRGRSHHLSSAVPVESATPSSRATSSRRAASSSASARDPFGVKLSQVRGRRPW